MTMHHVVLLRDDLRCADHPALMAACSNPNAAVTAIYAVTPEQWQMHGTAPVRLNFEWRALSALQHELTELNIGLVALEASNYTTFAAALTRWCQKHQVSQVFAHQSVAVNELARDALIASSLSPLGIELTLLEDSCLVPPGRLRTQQGDFFTVFTPFKRRWLTYLEEHPVRLLAKPSRRARLAIQPAAIRDFSGEQSLSAETRDYLWPATELAAHERLQQFMEVDGGRYQLQRDFPAINGTSTLSPYLAAGLISVRQCFHAAKSNLLRPHQTGLETWISELCWRDFYKHIMVGFPHVCRHRAFKRDTDHLPWRNHAEHFEAWCAGQTGFPIVDAAMRQLKQTGWMHNRLRMISAMFLTKDLFIDWRLGEQHFMRHLIDGDFSANNGGWQWSASTGNDAAPYFRVFNPTLQSERYDPDGAFIRQFVPELANLSASQIHAPYAKKSPIGLAYPRPIVDHGAARLHALQAFKSLEGLKKTVP